MSFLSLLTMIAFGILIASLITNFLKGTILVLSGLGICFYLFLATPDQRVYLDNYAKTVDVAKLTNLEYVKELEEYIKYKLLGLTKEAISTTTTTLNNTTSSTTSN